MRYGSCLVLACVGLGPSGAVEFITASGHTNRIEHLAVAADGTVASGGMDQTIRLWNASDLKPKSTIQAGGKIYALAFSPDGLHLAAGAGRQVKVYRAADGTTSWESPRLDGAVSDLAFSPNGQRLLVATSRIAWVHDAGSGERLSEAMQVTGDQAGWAWLGDETILTAAQPKTVSLFDAATGSLKTQNSDLPGRPSLLAVQPGGDKVALQLSDGKTATLNPLTGQVEETWASSNVRPERLIYSPDGNLLLGLSGGWLILRDANTGEVTSEQDLGQLSNDWANYIPLVISPDNRRLYLARQGKFDQTKNEVVMAGVREFGN